MITKRQYETARNQIKKAQDDAAAAMRKGDQAALDEATQRGAEALAVIADYKDEQLQKARK